MIISVPRKYVIAQLKLYQASLMKLEAIKKYKVQQKRATCVSGEQMEFLLV